VADVCDLSAARIAELVRGRELARHEVVRAHAARIAEPNPELNALVDLRIEAALVEADGVAEATRALFDRMRGLLWVNLFGPPAVAVGDGAQLVARRFHDRDALRAARACLGEGR
jgi:Asp-tRNA(Asn)/Glu-tRNA(Gln) amidotransferase A subunit family amidase